MSAPSDRQDTRNVGHRWTAQPTNHGEHRWRICPSRLANYSGWMLRGRRHGLLVQLFFIDEAEAREVQGYLVAGMSVTASRQKQYDRIDRERE